MFFGYFLQFTKLVFFSGYVYWVGQIKWGHTFQLVTLEELLGSSPFKAENKAI